MKITTIDIAVVAAEVLAISNGVVLRSIIDTQSPSDAERVVRAVCSEMVRVAKAFALPDPPIAIGKTCLNP